MLRVERKIYDGETIFKWCKNGTVHFESKVSKFP